MIAKKIKDIFVKKNLTLAIAESCSGGLVSHLLTNISGSSKYFKGGFIVYANEAKIKLLRVPSSLITKHGAVSRPVAESMAQAVRKILKTDFGISITGIAGPTGGSKEKPVGLTYIAVAKQGKVICKEFRFKGTRIGIKNQAAQSALKLLLQLI